MKHYNEKRAPIQNEIVVTKGEITQVTQKYGAKHKVISKIFYD